MRIYEYIPYQMSGASRMIYEYVPYQMSIKSLRKVDQEVQ